MFKRDLRHKFNLAKRRFDEGRYEDAWKIFDEIDDAMPNNAEVFYGQARCLIKLRRLDEAERLANRLYNLLNDPRGSMLRQKIEKLRQEQAPPE